MINMLCSYSSVLIFPFHAAACALVTYCGAIHSIESARQWTVNLALKSHAHQCSKALILWMFGVLLKSFAKRQTIGVSATNTARPLLSLPPTPKDHWCLCHQHQKTTGVSATNTKRPLVSLPPTPRDHWCLCDQHHVTTGVSATNTTRPLVSLLSYRQFGHFWTLVKMAAATNG